MSDNNKEDQEEQGAVDPAVAEGDTVAAPSSKKKKMIMIAAVVVIAVIGIGSFFFFQKHQADLEKEKETAKEVTNEPVFHDLDEIMVNLNTEGKNVSFMKLKVTLEIEGKENLDIVTKMMPRVRDIFQVYLRELRPIDVQGSVGLYRLREELLLRVNKVIFPAKVKDILFREVLVQ